MHSFQTSLNAPITLTGASCKGFNRRSLASSPTDARWEPLEDSAVHDAGVPEGSKATNVSARSW